MRYVNRTIVLLGIGLLMLSASFYSLPSLFCVLGAVIIIFCLVITLFCVVTVGLLKGGVQAYRWVLLALCCFLMVYGALVLGKAIGVSIADMRFRRNLGAYSKIVDDIRNGITPCNINLSRINVPQLPDNVVGVMAAYRRGVSIRVAFVAATDIPLLHEGYVYMWCSETNSSDPCDLRPEQRWPYIRRVDGNWYHFSDRPGL